VPRPRMRPVWNLEVPNVEKDQYKVFDHRTASFQDKKWKKNADGMDDTEVSGKGIIAPKDRIPCSTSDLRAQRSWESEWNKEHPVVFSRFNQAIHVNYRSYFDRWKDHDGVDVRVPTWRLVDEKRRPLQSASEPVLARGGRPPWKMWAECERKRPGE